MSYILDALKRADAERERGSVPGLHTQPAAVADDDEAAAGLKPWMWMALGVSLALAGTLAWRWLGSDGAPRDVATQPAPQMPPAPLPAAQAPVVVPVPAPTPAPTVAMQPPPPAATAPAHPAPSIQPPAAAVPPPRAIPSPAPSPAVRATTAPAPSPAPAPAAAPAAHPAPEARIYARNELPEEIRRELPTLAIGGSIYSENPASRFLIINGQVLHEGDKVNADLSLEQIKLKAAVLRYKGYRYEITY